MSNPFGFLTTQRIRSASEFSTLFKTGKRITVGCLALHYLIVERDYSRLGVVASKRHCPLAVHRNRIKRVAREKFRLNQHAFGTVDMIVSLRSSASNITQEELGECIEKLFSQFIAQFSGSYSH